MNIPKRVIYRQDSSPKTFMVGSGIYTGAGHPFQIRQDISVLFKALPVRCLV
jgi:hypothetical protein